MKRLSAILAAASLSGCANQILSDDHIRNDTALALNVPASAVTISGREYDGFAATYYRATVRGVSYRCLIEGGNLNSFGLTNPPECQRL